MRVWAASSGIPGGAASVPVRRGVVHRVKGIFRQCVRRIPLPHSNEETGCLLARSIRVRPGIPSCFPLTNAAFCRMNKKEEFPMKNRTTRTLVSLALLCAMEIVLARFCVIWITNSIKITFEAIPILLAGLLFGPVAGALVGAASDILGAAFLSGLGWMPVLTVTPLLLGLLPGLLRPFLLKKTTLPRVFAVTIPGIILGSMIWTTCWLSALYGTPLPALLAVRVPLYCVIGILDTLVVYLLYRSGAFQRTGLWPSQI